MTTAQRVFGRIFFELLYRSEKIRRYLEQVGPGESAEFVQLSRTINSALNQFQATAAAAVRQTRISAIDAADHKILLDALEVFSRAFSTIHEYFAYFPPLPVRPEAIHTLKSAFGDEFRRHEPSVLLTNSFNAFEFDFVRHLTSSLASLQVFSAPPDRNIVLQLPTVDVSAPLAWPLLAHEVGHAIDLDQQISNRIAARIGPGADAGVRALIQDMCEELTADLIAAKAIGPAAPLALLSFVYCLLPQEAVEWDPSPRLQGRNERVYPTTRWRARVAYEYLATKTGELASLKSEVEDFEAAWRFRAEVSLGVHRATAAAENEQEVYERLITTLASEIVKEIEDLPLQDFSLQNVSLTRHASRLERNLPVPAQGNSRALLTRDVRQYRQRKKSSREQFDSLVHRFEEKPTTVAAILLSGYVHRNKLIAEASAEPGIVNDTSASLMCARLERADTLLRTSIDGSAIHDRLLRRRRANEAVAAARGIGPSFVHSEVHSPTAITERSLLSDIQILARLVHENDERLLFISPLVSPSTQLGPSSLDVRLGTDVYVTTTSSLSHLDLEADREELERQKRLYFRRQRVGADGEFVLHPGEFVLAATLEYFRFPRDIAGRLEGRSSLGRLGLQVHATAGFVDPGFAGNLTFELINSGNLPIRIAPGFRLGQICFFPVSGVQVAYGQKPHSKYGGSISAEPSRVEVDPEILLPGARQFLAGGDWLKRGSQP